MPQTPNFPDHGTPADQLAAVRAADYDIVDPGKVEPKTTAATVAGAGSAAIITPAVVLAVDQLFYGGGEIDVPLPYVSLIGLVVTGVCTFAASYYARHVNRLR